MDLSIVFPMFWGREKKEIVKDGDHFYDHPTALDDVITPTIWRTRKMIRSSHSLPSRKKAANDGNYC